MNNRSKSVPLLLLALCLSGIIAAQTTDVTDADTAPPNTASTEEYTVEMSTGNSETPATDVRNTVQEEQPPEENTEQPTTDEAPQKDEIPEQSSARKTAQRSRIVRRFDGGVAAIADSAATRSFFAAGRDGFITRYLYGSLIPDTWQVSVLKIKRIAVHPKKAHIAVYETDGFGIHKVSLWDWQTKKQLYAKRFTDSVLSLSWSSQGAYLFIGTASTEGITVLDVKGNIKKIYPRPPGIVLLAATGPSEKSIVTYGETGRLVYADIAKRSILTQYDTEDRLENPELIKNYTAIIGYKNGNVMMIKAASGEVLQTYPARSALFAAKITDGVPVWIEQGDTPKTWHLCQGTEKSPAFSLPYSASLTAARHVDAAIVIGTDDGRLYRLTRNAGAAITLTELNPDTSIPVRDICIKDSNAYLFSGSTLYVQHSPDMSPEPIIKNITAERCTVYENGFLFWSATKASPLYYAEEGKEPEILYRLREPLNSVSVYQDSIAVVQAFSGLMLLDGKNGARLFTYKAAGLQDAVQVDDTFVLLAKSASGIIRQPLLLINVKTSETIPLKLEGELAFSLRANEKVKNTFSCFRLKTEDSEQTDLITIRLDPEHPVRTSFTTALSYSDEDLQACLYDDGHAVLTNLGKNQLIYYDKNRKAVRQLTREYALSCKALMTGTHIISLNYDGSLSWFNRRTMQLLENKGLTEGTEASQ